MLGGVVGGGSGKNASGGDRKIIHDRCAALHDHQCSLGDQEGAIDVGGEDVFPDWKRKLIYSQVGVRDACVVDHDIDATEFLPDHAKEAIDGVRIENVAGGNKYVRSLHFFAGPLEFRFAARCEDEVGALLAQRIGDSQTDTARGAGDEGSLALEALRWSAGQGKNILSRDGQFL